MKKWFILSIIFFISLSMFAEPSHGYVESKTGLEMVFLEGGTFDMGYSEDGWAEQLTKRVVEVSGFYISKYEVTLGLFRQFIKYTGYETYAEKGSGAVIGFGSATDVAIDANWKNPYFKQEDSEPVVCISWLDMIEFCNWISLRDGLTPVYTIKWERVTVDWEANGYRLPTEAEWEFAAIGGTRSQGYRFSGSDFWVETAWFMDKDNPGFKTRVVGLKLPNELGIYDMSGNVWEMCWDLKGGDPAEVFEPVDPKGSTSGVFRIARGGSWRNPAVRVTHRWWKNPMESFQSVGFRLVRNR